MHSDVFLKFLWRLLSLYEYWEYLKIKMYTRYAILSVIYFNFLFALDQMRPSFHLMQVQIAYKTYINANWNFYEHIKWSLNENYLFKYY